MSVSATCGIDHGIGHFFFDCRKKFLTYSRPYYRDECGRRIKFFKFRSSLRWSLKESIRCIIKRRNRRCPACFKESLSIKGDRMIFYVALSQADQLFLTFSCPQPSSMCGRSNKNRNRWDFCASNTSYALRMESQQFIKTSSFSSELCSKKAFAWQQRFG